MTSLSEFPTIDQRHPQEAEPTSLRKVTSLSALRGRSSVPRAASSTTAASKSSRAASLGRYRTKRHAATKERLRMPRTAQRSMECGYPRPGVVQSGDESSEPRVWAVGRLSMMFLLFVTFTDLAFQVVNNQMSQIESHDYYDALSPDVIRPAFLYKNGIDIEKPSLGLGSAAISSITDALGPILPFTGGVDLRRSEYYASGNVFETLYGLVQQTYQAYADAKEGQKSSTADNTGAKPKKSGTSKKVKHTLALGATDPFVPLDSIAELTLRDVGIIFDYAIQRSVDGFNPGKFQKGILPRAKTVIQALEIAIAKSRGQGVEDAKLSVKDTRLGNMDAFFFCAVMRVFAEWRVLRQVPQGYKGYAVGMSLGQKDVVQNVAKMERAAQAWIDNQSEFDTRLTSPTLQDVLQYELDSKEHENLPRLKEASGAMGLLWVRRQLQYQTVIFANIMDVGSKYSSSKDAVAAAYTEVYGQYHGWAVQQIFLYSFKASPKVEEIYKFMNPHRLAEVEEMVRSMEEESMENDGDEELSTSPDSDPHGEPPENLLHRIGWEWDKFVDGVGQNFKKLLNKDKKIRGGKGQMGRGVSGDKAEEIICAEMSKNAHEHVVSYLEVVTPLLGDLAGLLDEMNMNDPTKV